MSTEPGTTSGGDVTGAAGYSSGNGLLSALGLGRIAGESAAARVRQDRRRR
jgi:hypothetical protein